MRMNILNNSLDKGQNSFRLITSSYPTMEKFLVKQDILKVKQQSIISSGEQVGESALQGDALIEHTVAAISKTHLLEFPQENYLKSIEEYNGSLRNRIK